MPVVDDEGAKEVLEAPSSLERGRQRWPDRCSGSAAAPIARELGGAAEDVALVVGDAVLDGVVEADYEDSTLIVDSAEMDNIPEDSYKGSTFIFDAARMDSRSRRLLRLLQHRRARGGRGLTC